MKHSSVCSRFLSQLDVPHTESFTDRHFAEMPYSGTLKGFADLLDEYDVATQFTEFATPADLTSLKTPFMAMVLGKLVIVTKVSADSVTYATESEESTVDAADFIRRSNRKALLATADAESREPDLNEHRRMQVMTYVRRYGIPFCAAVIAVWVFILGGLYQDWPTLLVGLFDMVGIYICYLLLQKQLHISNAHGDAICGFLEKGGCGKIMDRKVSKIFGVIGWGEVGMAYFSVSLIALIAAPESLPYLALYNAFCLPYTVWSIGYQKFVAKTWCTLCVTVQTLQWLLFGSYLLAGAWHGLWPVHATFFILGFGYLGALLVVDRLLPVISSAHSLKEVAGRYDNLRLRSDVFAIEQQDQPQTAPSASATGLLFGDRSRTPDVLLFIDPTTEDAGKLHREVDELVKKGLTAGYLLRQDTPELVAVARYIISLYLTAGANRTWQLLGRWADTARKPDYFKSFGLDAEAPAVTAELERQEKYLKDSYLYATPTFIVGDRILNPLYTPSDLIYIY